MKPGEIPREDLSDYAPEECLGDSYPLPWQMTRQEKFCLLQLLRVMVPDVAIEVGTYRGGSLQVLSRFSRNVISIDIDPSVPSILEQRFSNVEFRTGDSADLLPRIIEQLNDSSREVGFILIDGDHSELAVSRDVASALRLRPKRPACIVIHDSFHPSSRRGLRQADWKSNPYLHYVELDFANGILVPGRASAEEAMFGGLALALMLPRQRNFELSIFESQARLFEIVAQCAEISQDKPS